MDPGGMRLSGATYSKRTAGYGLNYSEMQLWKGGTAGLPRPPPCWAFSSVVFSMLYIPEQIEVSLPQRPHLRSVHDPCQ